MPAYIAPHEPEVPLIGGARPSIEEQEYRGRDKYAIPEDDRRVAPRGLIDRPSPTGR